jgi:hypothetical protein
VGTLAGGGALLEESVRDSSGLVEKVFVVVEGENSLYSCLGSHGHEEVEDERERRERGKEAPATWAQQEREREGGYWVYHASVTTGHLWVTYQVTQPKSLKDTRGSHTRALSVQANQGLGFRV